RPRFSRQIRVLATEEHQRIEIRPRREAHHPADEDDVIAAIIVGVGCALEMRESVPQQRRLGKARLMLHVGELVGKSPCELVRQLLLRPTEDVDRIALSILHRLQAVGFPLDAEQDKRWIERDRVEGTHGHADRLLVGTHGRDDGYARCKLTQRVAERPPIELAAFSSTVLCLLLCFSFWCWQDCPRRATVSFCKIAWL